MDRRLVLTLSCVILALSISVITPLAEANAPPQLKSPTVTPTAGDDKDSYVFTVRYFDPENRSPESIRVYIDGTPHDMARTDPEDTNYTDGMDYNYRTGLSEGTYIYYVRASDGENETQTVARTLYVRTTSIFRMEHSDVVRVILYFSPFLIIVSVVLLIQMYKVTKALDRLAGKKASDTERGPDERPSVEEEGPDRNGPSD